MHNNVATRLANALDEEERHRERVWKALAGSVAATPAPLVS